ncbi:hypothetical protein [Clostridium estertheticum]|uniref:Uncharacterized protein n=1 Tax=Clostridium estertheticum TaxID=238834 RepID=A0AA47I6X4_9CLOT|nr:hypothetical protein [Clostridium estertheticum]MBU3154392.1 hypothetical protein [Clostridium estertheticum]WAG60280.1 hypothetical protein LL038_22610 [Clostridium estertheticum]
MKEKRPVLVTYIVDLNFLNVFLLIISSFPKFTKQFGIVTETPTFFNVAIKALLFLILLTISYGLLRLKKWSYWMMITYNMFFLILSIIYLLKLTGPSSYNQGCISSILGLTLIFSAKRYFIKSSPEEL